MSLANTDIAPVFIVGSARAGTSALVAALRDGVGMPCDNEGHLVSMINPMLKRFREYRDFVNVEASTLRRVRAEVVEDFLLEAIRKAQESAFPAGASWFDKTPDDLTLRAIPYILKMWPRARFIFAKRRAIENIVSRTRKFPHLSFQSHCERWVMAMTVWEERRDQIPEAQRIEIEQREMSLDPKATGVRLSAFLGLDEVRAQGISDVLARARPEFTGGDERAQTSLDNVGWSKQQIETYRQICGHVAARWGYSDDASYYS